MVGYDELRVQWEVALYLFNVIRGKIINMRILGMIEFSVPDRYVERRCRPCLLTPLASALSTPKHIAEKIDLFSCSVSEFIKITYDTCYYLLFKKNSYSIVLGSTCKNRCKNGH
ncbi:unnamed protein product [Diatraea saccharalis]|uniref:Uncharacterized protein n=1 Tax=Diatraea saccharalis TaxID=40085 RepID=A0A9N9QY59_9NEOP|nr:unnamed protein product [Diatraea saccharalis]